MSPRKQGVQPDQHTDNCDDQASIHRAWAELDDWQPAVTQLPTDRTAAVSELFNAHYAHFVRMARLLVDDTETAEDVVMDAFTSLHRRWTAIREPDEAYRYLRSCVLNGARSNLRRRRVRRLYDTPLAETETTAEDVAVSQSNRAAVMASLRALPLRQRQVLVLRYFADLSEAQIALELGISQGTVKTHASRGLAALAQPLEVCR